MPEPRSHLYTATMQPATCFVDRNSDKPMWFRYKPRCILLARCCCKLRWAKHLLVQVFYDGWRFWCRPGRGCKKGEPNA